MKPIKTFQLPDSIVQAIGKEWAGAYTVHELNAREYVQALSEATSFMVEECAKQNADKPEEERTQWNGVISEDVMRVFLVCKSVTLNGRQLDPRIDLPAKLYEPLSLMVLPLNTLSMDEFKTLFLSSSITKSATSPPSST